MRIAILEDVSDWKQLSDPLEIAKAHKRMRMLYAHLLMYDTKMQEVRAATGGIEKPILAKDINQKGDKDFVYF